MLFRIHHRANYGDRLVLLGSTIVLGKWDPDNALPATWTHGDIWTVSDIPRPTIHAPTRFEFKFCLMSAAGALVWEPAANHVAHLPVHPVLPIILSVEWGLPACIYCPAHTTLSPLNTSFPDANSPPPTPAKNSIASRADADANPLAIAVARVKADKANGHIHMVPVKFRMKYRLDPGENIYVVGGIPELGSWNKMHSPMLVRQDGVSDVFEAAMVIPHDVAHEEFGYKYFTRRIDGTRRWEEGENRVARPFDEKAPKELVGDCAALWNDRWEKIRYEFSIYYPTKKTQVMHVTGDPTVIGGWFKPGPTKMELGPVQMLETDVKGRKWYLNVWMGQEEKSFSYRYIVIDKESKEELWEREPNRRAEFDVEKTVVNGVRILTDVNFVSGLNFDKVPPNMYIGPYPQVPADVDAMAEGGVTGVFNVQTDEDFKHRGIQWDVLMKRYKERGITVVRYPIRDFDRDSLRQHLRGATQALDELLRSGKKVYIHCTAGMGRAPACAVAYLCWVKKMELMEAVAHVKKYRTVAVPNVPVLEQALKEPY